MTSPGMPDRTQSTVQSDSLLVAAGGARGDDLPPQLGRPHGLLRQLEKGYLYGDRILGRLVPESLNPLIQLGCCPVDASSVY